MTELAEGISVDIAKEDPEKYLKVKIVEIDFVDSYKTQNSKRKVVAPHWPCGKYKFNYSEKPAALKIGKESKAILKVKVDSKGVSGNGVIKGTIKGYVFEGKIPLSNGDKTVSVTMKKSPDDLQWLKGKVLWDVNGGDVMAAAGSTYVELFFIFDDPSKLPFFSKGVWAEALRYLFEKGRVRGVGKKNEAVKKVTECCFNLKNHKYDIKKGASSFGGASKTFELLDYMKPTDDEVNCYDQTYAVIVFSGALGLAVDGLFMDPFGFLNLTNLVGRGMCNNPFPYPKYNREIVRHKASVTGKIKLSLSAPKVEKYLIVKDDDPDRQPFGNHMYCEYKSNIFDACAGPSVGVDGRAGYVKSNIDSTTSLNVKYSGLPGKVSGITTYDKCLFRGYHLVDATVVKVV